jgi:hypothetical protein
MCDYSLHFVATRPAKVRDKLVTTRFRESYTRGFAAVGEPNVAVCLLPGTEIAFDREVECDRGFGLLPRRRIASIAPDDELILPHRANPRGWDLRERQVTNAPGTGPPRSHFQQLSSRQSQSQQACLLAIRD